MKINIHAGHGAADSKSCGAIGLINESTEARKVKNEVMRLLKSEGHVVYDCTIDYPSSKSDCVKQIVAKCNQNSVPIDISIHFNAGANKTANNSTTGVEVLTYSSTSKANEYAKRICERISKLGYKNRGVKYRTDLGVLKTQNPNLLIECCFVDDPEDVALYNYSTMAKAIVEGILNKDLQATESTQNSSNNNNDNLYYRVVVGSYKSKESAEKILEQAKEKGFGSAFITTFAK